MRISDWSSDVCSSDLPQRALAMACALCGVSLDKADPRIWDARELGLFDSLPSLRVQATNILGKHDLLEIGRASSRGKSVSVRVDLGGRRIIKKKTKYER